MKASRPTPAEFLMRVVGSPTPTIISFMFQRLYRQLKADCYDAVRFRLYSYNLVTLGMNVQMTS